jgi:hypothetical protein
MEWDTGVLFSVGCEVAGGFEMSEKGEEMQPDPCFCCGEFTTCDLIGGQYLGDEVGKYGEPVCMLAYRRWQTEVEEKAIEKRE